MAVIASFRFKAIRSVLPAAKTTPSPKPSVATHLLLFPSSDSKRSAVRFLLHRHHSPLTSTHSSPASAPTVARYDRDSLEDAVLNVDGIRSATVRLIDAEQNMVGVVSKDEAIRMAADVGLELVIVSPDADPPVVKIMDYSKFKYELQKKKKGQLKKSAASRMDIKELKMSYNIDDHDYGVRLKAARKFLEDGDKVKIIVNLKGRENEFRNIAIELLKRFRNDVGKIAIEESKNFRERNVYITLVPNKVIAQQAQEKNKKKDNPIVNEMSANGNLQT